MKKLTLNIILGLIVAFAITVVLLGMFVNLKSI